ncbi:MAG: hypothetical protein ABIY52_09600 [Gemmatimonadaceae bacterium]
MDKPAGTPKLEPLAVDPLAIESLPERTVTDAKAGDVKGGARTADPTPPVGGLIDRTF